MLLPRRILVNRKRCGCRLRSRAGGSRGLRRTPFCEGTRNAARGLQARTAPRADPGERREAVLSRTCQFH
jgi:hypothetical protein